VERLRARRGRCVAEALHGLAHGLAVEGLPELAHRRRAREERAVGGVVAARPTKSVAGGRKDLIRADVRFKGGALGRDANG
jgi:hypothetical protein